MRTERAHPLVLTLAAFALCAGLAGCDPENDADPGSLSGRVLLLGEVTGLDGQPFDQQEQRAVANALVSIEELGAVTSTLEDGSFRFPSLPPGDYELTVSVADGILAAARSIEIVEGVDSKFVSPFVLTAASSELTVSPNPGTSRTALWFDVPEAIPTDVVVYDGGTVVRTLARDQRFSPGRHGFLWDFTDDHGFQVQGEAFLLVVLQDGAQRTAAVLRDTPPETLSIECRTFIEEHWSEAQFEQALAEGRLEAFFPELGSGSTPEDIPIYVRKAEDPIAWYMNALEWDVFAWGWREFWDDGWNAVHHPVFIGPDYYIPQPELPFTWFYEDWPLGTPLRDEAWGLCEGGG